MFEKIYVEREIFWTPEVQQIITYFPQSQILEIDNHLEILKQDDWQNRNLVLASKKGELIKKVPDNYNRPGTINYSIIHSYNCLFNCEYCYLQGYFRNGYVYLFLNYADIVQAMEHTLQKIPQAYFHLGEFSDSLVFEEWSGLARFLLPHFTRWPQAKLEIRTKSVNITPLHPLRPSPNVILSWSLNPSAIIEDLEHGTPPLTQRLQALKTMAAAGWTVAIRLDPIVYHTNWERTYGDFISTLKQELAETPLDSVSIGLFRSNLKTKKAILRRWPDTPLYTEEIIPTADKLKYFLPIRRRVYNFIQERLQEFVPKNKIFICMDPLP